MPRPFRTQAQYSRTNLKCHLGQSCSQPAKSWFIYTVDCGRRNPPCQGVRGGQLGAPDCSPLAWALLRITIWKPLWLEDLGPMDPTHASPTPASTPLFQGPRAGQELLVMALAPILCQAVCCMLHMVFSLNSCQALRGEMISPMSQVRKLRLG